VTSPRTFVCLTFLLLLVAAASLAGAGSAAASTPPQCAPQITSTSAAALATQDQQSTSIDPPAVASPSAPCWTDVTPYPFGSDGNQVDPTSTLCTQGAPSFVPNNYGPGWGGDFDEENTGDPPCYLQVDSLAFRAWNRGLAATSDPAGTPTDYSKASTAYGVWLYNGHDWYPDPSFPGSSICPGTTIMWAGKLDYWLVGSSASPQLTLCHFDGVNLDWEPLSLPAATLARLPFDPETGKVVGNVGITSGACYAYNNCWFFGTDGIEVHWDGQSLTDATPGLGASPWLDGDFTNAVAGTDGSGQPFGVALSENSYSATPCNPSAQTDPCTNILFPPGAQPAPVPKAPDGSPPPQLFSSLGGPWMDNIYTLPSSADPGTTDLTLAGANASGQVWVAGAPGLGSQASGNGEIAGAAPLEPLAEAGSPRASCQGYGAGAFPSTVSVGSGTNPNPVNDSLQNGYKWYGLATFPDGSALAGAGYDDTASDWNVDVGGTEFSGPQLREPLIVHATCSGQLTFTQFRRPDPYFGPDQAAAPMIPADAGGSVTATAATNASNAAWAATSGGNWGAPSGPNGGPLGPQDLAPLLYLWTDGQPPDAPPGDDNEPRPSLFTLSPPVYQVSSPTVVVQNTRKTVKRHQKPRTVNLPPAIYAVHSKLTHGPRHSFTLYLIFKVRRPVTVELQADRGHRVVASSGFKRFTGSSGRLGVRIVRKRWPTGLHLVSPKGSAGH